MLACLKTATGKTETLALPTPEAGPGQIVIKTTMCTVCGSDMHWVDEMPNEIMARLAPDVPFPHGFPMGHEAGGLVHEVGPGVTRVQVGARVISSCLVGCGRGGPCLHGDFSICTGGGRTLFGCPAGDFLLPLARV